MINNTNREKCGFSGFEAEFVRSMQSLTSGGGHVIVGFSGGADSSALLFLLAKFGRLLGLSVSAIHINHKIRGSEAERDVAFCLAICSRANIECCIKEFDVPRLAMETGSGLEEAARNCRYSAYDEYAKVLEAKYERVFVATAHNADDNIETVLFNLTRGTGISGLCGIPHSRQNIIRPLLFATKSEITDYCRDNGIEYITDSTNSDISYTRNRIRHTVVPSLKVINPNLGKTVLGMTERLSADRAYLERAAQRCFQDLKRVGKLTGESLDPAILPRIVMLEAESVGATELSALQIGEISRLCRSGTAHMKVMLKQGFVAECDRGSFRIVRHEASEVPAVREYSLPLDYGVIELPIGLAARFPCEADSDIIRFKQTYKNAQSARILRSAIKGKLFVRTKREGDVYSLNFVNRKVKKLFCECIPLDQRAMHPLFCDSDGILWIPSFRSRSESCPKHDEAHDIIFFVNNIDDGGQNK